RAVVEQVRQQLGSKTPAATTPAAPKVGAIPVISSRNGSSYGGSSSGSRGSDGVFQAVDDAVAAAGEAFEKFRMRPVSEREKVVQIVKTLCEREAEELGRMEMEETKIGRLDHKIEKLKIIKLVPGTEFLKPTAYTGDRGLTM